MKFYCAAKSLPMACTALLVTYLWCMGSYASDAPTLSIQPPWVSAGVGTNVSLSASVKNTSALSFQWSANAIPIPGAIESSYTITNAQVSNSASYRVVANTAAGSLTSAPVTVIVWTIATNPPIISKVTQTNLTVTEIQPRARYTFQRSTDLVGWNSFFSYSGNDAEVVVRKNISITNEFYRVVSP